MSTSIQNVAVVLGSGTLLAGAATAAYLSNTTNSYCSASFDQANLITSNFTTYAHVATGVWLIAGSALLDRVTDRKFDPRKMVTRALTIAGTLFSVFPLTSVSHVASSLAARNVVCLGG